MTYIPNLAFRSHAADQRHRPHAPRLRRAPSARCAQAAGTTPLPAAIVQAFWSCRLHRTGGEVVRHRLLVEDAAYFLKDAHGFNSVHGRMPALATGAIAANGETTISVSRATATRCRSASVSWRMPSAATSTCCACWRTTASTAHEGQFSPRRRPWLAQQEGRSNTMEPIDGCLAGDDARCNLRGPQLLGRQRRNSCRCSRRASCTRAWRSSTSSRRA